MYILYRSADMSKRIRSTISNKNINIKSKPSIRPKSAAMLTNQKQTNNECFCNGNYCKLNNAFHDIMKDDMVDKYVIDMDMDIDYKYQNFIKEVCMYFFQFCFVILVLYIK